jgi:hypothetical protein
MKTRMIKALIVVGFVLGAWRLGQAQAQVAQFHFTVQRSETGVKTECSQGCAWKTHPFDILEASRRCLLSAAIVIALGPESSRSTITSR